MKTFVRIRPAAPPRLPNDVTASPTVAGTDDPTPPASTSTVPEAAPERGASGGASVLVVVPVLGRPECVEPLVESMRSSVESAPLRLVFVTSPSDYAELDAVSEFSRDSPDVSCLVAGWEPGPADWARKVNLAYRTGFGDPDTEPWLLTGADDLCFCPGWADRALKCAEATGAGVVGTNDLGNPRVMDGSTATHNLVARWYADQHGTVDGPGRVVSEAYDHNFVDDELVATARARGLWTFCAESEVPHLHPHWGEAEWDETYEKGQRRFAQDRTLFQRRRRLIARAGRR